MDTTTSQDWGWARRIGFRFAIVLGGLMIFPFPVVAIPKLDWLAAALRAPLESAAQWFATRVLGLGTLVTEANGSGDRRIDYVEVLVLAIVAVVATALWSALDRRRAYPRLAAAVHVVLRYYLAFEMLSYGFIKILKEQFPDPSALTLYSRIGDGSPMHLLWTFMGASTAYTVFAGLSEAVGGALLLWRRTATLGALLLIVVLTNVVILNFCYDVPAKLFSTQLLLVAGAIALPAARRLVAAVLGRPTGDVPPRAPLSPRRERVRVVAKLVVIALFVVRVGLYAQGPSRNDHIHELWGNWAVDRFTADGVEHAPLTTDPVRWRAMTANARIVVIWLVSGDTDPPSSRHDRYYRWKVDATNHTIAVTIDAKADAKETWRYTRPAPDRLVIDAVHLGKTLHVELHREPEALLRTRGFRWINEAPFNR